MKEVSVKRHRSRKQRRKKKEQQLTKLKKQPLFKMEKYLLLRFQKIPTTRQAKNFMYLSLMTA